MRLAYAAYQFLGWIGFALAWPFLAVKALRDPRYRVGWGERLGFWGPSRGTSSRPVWVHGASVGEIRAALPLLSALRGRGVALVVSTTSPSGRTAATAAVGEGGSAHLLPLDLAPLVRRVLRSVRPRALVIVETEIWPSLLLETRRARVPVVLVNARLSDRTFPRYRSLRRLLGPLFDCFAQIQTQSVLDASRFVDIGARQDRVLLGGNLKFDVPRPNPADPAVVALRRARAGGWRVVIGGSTHPGEEEALLAAGRSLDAQGLHVGLVLAPRHLERLQDVEATIRSAGRQSRRWSQLEAPLEVGILAAFEAQEVILVDRYGLLGRLYGAAEIGFVGGTLAPVGGHNLLEPLIWGVPVVFGPHTANAREVRDEVLRRKLGAEVAASADLPSAFARYLTDPEAEASVRSGARHLFQENRGAVDRAVTALEALGALDRDGMTLSFYFLAKDFLTRPVVGMGSRLLVLPLTVLAWLYGRVLALRRWSYRRGVLKAYQAGVPVISIGNVTAGGTGKTPCVEAVCRMLLDAGVKPAVLSRGYGRKGGRPYCVVSAGDGTLVSAEEGGDEPVFLAERLPGVPVLVGRDRRITAREAVGRFGAQALVLDDGFQHLALARDLDIVTVDVTNPLGNGYTLPRGLLREPAAALSEADLILLTRAGRADPRRVEGVRRLVRRRNHRAPVVASSHAAVRLTDLAGNRRALSTLSGLKVIAFAGIANPTAFFQELEALGARVIETVPYPDHHCYSLADLKKMEEWAGLMNAQAVVTTEKDAVRLAPFLPLPFEMLTLGIELQFLDGEEVFRARVLDCLSCAARPAPTPSLAVEQEGIGVEECAGIAPKSSTNP